MAAERGTSPAGGGRSRGRRGVSRRTLLVGGGTAAVLGGVGYGMREDLRGLWYRIPGNAAPRIEGEVDFPEARWVAASGANWRLASRPHDFTVDRVVIHVIQGSYATALRVFQDAGHGAATHYVVRTSDGRVAQMVRELDVAYHAGNRSYNERSVGIEHEGFVDRPEDFTDGMYRASARLTADICDRYSLPKDREHIVGHNEVPGADHTDPGPHWDWERYLRMVRDARPVPRPSATPVSG
ncbi:MULTISPECIES: N-acetylmuramoyl-L-alanine amidase [unclassified Streptomyces]|uniref:N-acetylmuramoyl-L-alanine amidase n=1 Tax=unclassified Streptomyces TaxID=2593676 RepID=UPI0022B6CAB5|nr:MULTISPECIES: peptidoglycan recognition family protein [unclassified Streptomyces]MCZ7416389.1 peptidoglycan recognition family protein [Streptomyces sp. WMMC897]MCZ7433801.1 peptidoglycan recognition family protein [Streptomyces sp. WMMC1477]